MNYANVKVKFLNPFFLYKFLSCACMSKLLPPKYYQKNKERLQKKNACEDIKIYLKNKKKKSGNMVVNVTKISQRMNGLVQKKY